MFNIVQTKNGCQGEKAEKVVRESLVKKDRGDILIMLPSRVRAKKYDLIQLPFTATQRPSFSVITRPSLRKPLTPEIKALISMRHPRTD
jgi:hypothetical protein